MKKTLFGLLTVILLVACEQEKVLPTITQAETTARGERGDRETAINKPWMHRLIRKRTVWTEPTKQTVTDLHYTYNNLGQLALISGTKEFGTTPIVEITLSYDAQGRLTTMKHAGNLKWEFSYDNKNLVKQVRTITVDGNLQGEWYYTNHYDALNRMIESRYYAVEQGIADHKQTLIYSYAGENVVKIEKYAPDGAKRGEINFTHDTGRVPLNNVQNLSVPRYITSDLPGASLSVNNILSEIHTDAAGTRNTINSYGISYEYGAGGLPITSLKTWDRGYTERTEYTYETRILR